MEYSEGFLKTDFVSLEELEVDGVGDVSDIFARL
jgi:hypothetical protein